MSSTEELMQFVELYGYNPAAIQRKALELVREAYNGELNVVDPTNPFVLCLESGAVLVAGAMNGCRNYTYRQYPKAALTEDQLYLHMSDRDFVGRFATPAETKFAIMISKKELIDRMVDEVALGTKKIVIPRNTVFTIAETNFSLQYPVVIRLLAHGGFQISYDADIVSPLQTLVSNNIDFETRVDASGNEWLFFEVDVQQFDIITKYAPLNAATSFQNDIAIDHQFYFCRVYQEMPDGSWSEIQTTHTPDVFDIRVPTAVIRVVDKNVNVSIPQIYTTTSMLNRTLRIDVYQTRGPINMVMDNYDVGAFSAQWLAIDDNELNDYTAPLNAFREIMVFSTHNIASGTNALDFEVLREQVLTNSVGINQIPITPDQRNAFFTKSGYDIVTNVDHVTDRIFLATRELPVPSNKVTRTPAATAIKTIKMSMEELVALSGVLDNGLRITITPDALYRSQDGIVRHLSQAEVQGLQMLPNDSKVTIISNSDYFYSPFHYVLDATEQEFALRPYYLDSPTLDAKQYVDENDTTLMQISASSYGIEKTPTGFNIYIVTESSDNVKEFNDDEIIAQIAYYPPGETDRAYLNGTFMGRQNQEFVFKFEIQTNFDIDSKHSLYLKNFMMYIEEAKIFPISLLTNLDVLFATTRNPGAQFVRSKIDDVMGSFLLPDEYYGIKHEKLRVTFGQSLDMLWARARSVAAAETYRRADVDIPAYYESDIYDLDPETKTIFKIVDGEVVYTLLHKKGDPVLDVDGQPVYLYRRGDILLDENKKPILESPRKIVRLADIFMIDGGYYFATDSAVVDYKKEFATELISQLTGSLANIGKLVLEKTRVFFYPKITMGMIDVMVEDGLRAKISAQQSFSVTLYVADRVYNNEELRKRLEENTADVIMAVLKQPQIAVSAIIEQLRKSYGEDVIDVVVTGLGGQENLDLATIINTTDRCSIKKRLIALADNTITLVDDVAVNFIRHRE